MKITVIGTGYVGLVTGTCLSRLGFEVHCVDTNPAIVEKLNAGIPTIYESGLEPLLRESRRDGSLRFHTDLAPPVSTSDMIFLAVGTPTIEETGEADLTYLDAAVRALTPHLRSGATVVVKSTVPVGTNNHVLELIRDARPELAVSVASNPEFLREGSAIADFFEADRIVCGVRDDQARAQFITLYRGIVERGSKLVFTSPENAELAKYASNAFLAMKITFINEIADLCEAANANVDDVAELMGMDNRIGSAFLKAGPGYGGSCFPKDTKALLTTAKKLGVSSRLVEATIAINDNRKEQMVTRILDAIGPDLTGKSVAVLGVTFKANTDDVRDAASLTVIPQLQAAGLTVRAHDPMGRKNAEKLLPGVVWFDRAIEAARGTDAVIILTEWKEYSELRGTELAAALKGRHVFDWRNALPLETAHQKSLSYRGIGRGAPTARPLDVVTVRKLLKTGTAADQAVPIRSETRRALEKD